GKDALSAPALLARIPSNRPRRVSAPPRPGLLLRLSAMVRAQRSPGKQHLRPWDRREFLDGAPDHAARTPASDELDSHRSHPGGAHSRSVTPTVPQTVLRAAPLPL